MNPESITSKDESAKLQPIDGYGVNDTVPDALLKSYPTGVMIEYTSKCNLRCKYCTKSDPGDDQIPGRDMDMDSRTLASVIASLGQNKFQEILLAGTGESTFHPHWTEDFPRLIQAGKAANPSCYIHLNSNFAIKYEDQHWATLSQLDGIVISIDTSDRQSTREVRAKSDIGLIIYNIVRFKAYCDTRNLRFPKISINVTLYQEAAAGLPELINMLATLPISHVSISDMVETKAAKVFNVRALNTDHLDSFINAVDHLQKAITNAQTLGRFSLSVQPHLIERINDLVEKFGQNQLNDQQNAEPQIEAPKCIESIPIQYTKICLQPWTRFTIAADASLYPCCVTDMPPVGSVSPYADAERDGLNGERMRRFRYALLVGQPPAICVECTNAPTGPIAKLEQAVKNLVEKRQLQ